MKLAVVTGRKEHAARINEAWQKGVDAVVKTGLRIEDAKADLSYGEYEEMVRTDLHFSPQTALKLRAIASNKVLSNPAHVRHLPPSWGTLSELAVIANKGFDLEAGIESGAIHPRMERRGVKALLPQRDDDLPDDDATPTADMSDDGDDAADASAWKLPRQVTAAEHERLAERFAARLIEFDREAARMLHEWITTDERRALKTLCRVIERELVGTEEAAASADPDRWSDR